MAVIMGLFISSSVLAQNGNVREETARQVGLNFLRLKDGNPRSDVQLTRVDAVQYPNLYVYNTSENGFIVVASDNRMEPILAYSDEGIFDKDNVAPGANFWFEMYEYAIDSIVRNNVRDVDERISKKWEDLENGILPEKSRDLTFPQFCEPLIRTKWGQGDYENWTNDHNRFCPWYEKNGKIHRTVTGCVATALGQLVNFLNVTPNIQAMSYAFTHLIHEDYPNEFTNLHLTSLFGEDVNSVVYPGCDNLNSTRKYYYWGDWNIKDEKERAAQIMFDCGLAVDMRYGIESSAFNLQPSCPNRSSAESALKNYFGYSKAYGIYKRDYSNNQWQDTLKKYISHNLPLIYGGTNTGKGSHSFICDGYDAWNYFHFNYGGYGIDDGYYWVCWQGLYHHYPQILYDKDQECLIAYPIMQYNVTNINDEIEFLESKITNWNNSTIVVKYDENQSIDENPQTHTYTIKYNHPGYYRLNPIIEDDKLLNYSVRIFGIDTIRKSETICRREGFNKIYGYEGNNVSVSLNRDETDFNGTQQFYADINNNVSGDLVAILEVSLTTSGAISEHTLSPITVSRCDLPHHGNYYYWDIGEELIRCEYSGIYEKVFDRNGECDSVVYLNLTIEEPETKVYIDTLLCYNSCPFIFHGIEIDLQTDTIGRITTYNVCEDNVLYTLELSLIDTIRLPVDIDICSLEAPYTWHGHELPWTTPGFYDTIFKASTGCECDTVYYLSLHIADCCIPDLDCLEEKINEGNRNASSNMETIYYELKHYFEYRDAMNSFLFNVFDGITWPSIEDRNTFWNLFQSLLDAQTGMMTEQTVQQLIAINPCIYVSEDYITNLVERYNRSVMYWNEDLYSVWHLPQGYNPNFIEYDTASMNKAYEAYDYAIEHGFSNVKAMYDNAYELLESEVDNIQSTVCAQVTVQFTQKMTMTREAFNGTLQIFNGHESVPMEDIMVDFRIKDSQGNDCTNLFQINTLSLDQITGISGDGSLAAQTNGTALVQFIPTKNAAPTQPVVYYFGGSFSFIDPFTGEGLTYPLYPVDITVNPSPDLYVDYFMQRDILGDDALTLGVIEPSIPAELGVIIHNKGAGIAKNVTLETAEPEIIDNEHGLAIEFAMYGASFNGSPRQLGLMEIPFGNIESGQTAVGEWLFTSSLLGHFVSYTAHVIHNSSYDNPDLSLVSHLDIHELVHPIYAYGNLDDGINDFLVNDNPDAYDTPDSIYFSHGGKTVVGIVDNISFDHYVEPLDTIVTLTINPSRIGWNYGVTDDPGMDKYDVVSCTRDIDGQEIPLQNVWQTFVTIPDDGDPVYENKLHIIDTLSNDAQDYTYTLVYSLKTNLLDIEEISGIPEEFIEYPLESFIVKFNEAIVDSTFTYEDMTLKCNNGSNLMNESVVITKIDETTYEVNISGITNETGFFVLNVNTLNICDTRGYGGYNGKQASWVQVITNYTQTNSLISGWNWWSTYIDMSTEQDFDKLKNALGSNASMIKSRTEGFVSYYGGWYGTLNMLTNTEMYMINMNSMQNISIVGPLTSLSGNPITLNQGWNWIGYPTNMSQEINAALVNLPALGSDMLKSRNAFATYYPSLGWIGTLTNLSPGTGYMYNSSNTETVSFVYASPSKMENQPQEVDATNHWEVSVGEYETNATIIGVIDINSVEQRDENLIVGAFIGDRCVGQTNAIYVEAIDRYFVFLTYFGNDNDEITFRMFDEANNMEYDESETTVIFEANSMLGTIDNPFIIDFNISGVSENGLAQLTLFPNPVSAGTNVRIRLNDNLSAGMDIEIITDMGTEYDKITSRGNIVEMKAPDIPGIYMVKITDKNGNVNFGKLIVK